MPSSRPNVLLITTDQQRWDYLGHHQVPGLHTPHLDQLATDGRIFPHTYTVSPICTPCRVSLLTGQYPSRHGATSIGSATSIPTETLPQLLSQSGYRTGLFGKSHFVPRPCEAAHLAGRWQPGDPLPTGDLANLAHDTAFWRSFDGPYLGFDVHRGAAPHTCDRRPDLHYRTWLEDQGVDLAAVDALHEPAFKYTPGPWALPAEWHQTHWMTEESLRFIDANATQPWFCWTSIQDPHSPFVCPEPWYSAVEPEPAPPARDAHPGKPAYYDLLVQENVFEHGLHHFYDEDGLGCPHTLGGGKLDGQAAINARRAYKGMCNMIDTYVGKLITHLKATGQYDNTLIVFTSDHGDFLGDHGLWFKGLPAFDAGQRVPMVVKAPAQQATGSTPDLISLIDLPATFLAAAGLPIPPTFQGVNQLDAFAGRAPAVRDQLLVECNPTARANQFTLVTSAWKLVVYQNIPDGELYDRAADPDQHVNLWASPAHLATRAELLHRLSQEILRRDAHHPPRIANA